MHSSSDMCRYDFNSKARGKGWEAGICFTDEQIWCRAHPNRHADCSTADCRAEEIRMTLWRGDRSEGPPAEAAYTGCPAAAVDAIRAHIADMNKNAWPDRGWADGGRCGACVPAGDSRSAYLPACSEAQALCRGLYFRPTSNVSSWDCAQKPINYEDVADRNNDFFGCS